MTDTARQIPFDLRPRTALGRQDFLIAPCNQDAVAWIDLWPDWPAPALILSGDAASGKTHLAAVWRDMANAAWIDAAQLVEQDADSLSRQAVHLVIDHLDPWIGDRAAETTLFHLYNIAKERGSSILITMRSAPNRIAFEIPDVSSRLRAAPAITIQSPDDTLLASVLVKLFSDRQLKVETDVIAYMLPRMERSFAAARDIVERADHMALSEKKPLTVPLLRRVFAQHDE